MMRFFKRQAGDGASARGLRAAALGLTGAVLIAAGAAAQTETPFAGFKHDANQPIEVSADSLEVRNTDQVAIFRGSVDVRQGVVRMTANQLEVTYRNRGGGGGNASVPGSGAIDRLVATGDVLMSNGEETARSDRADYDVAAGEILLTGEVLLVQGENAIKGPRLRIDLASGTARMEGRVQVQLTPQSQ